jgi:hypothetical protein
MLMWAWAGSDSIDEPADPAPAEARARPLPTGHPRQPVSRRRPDDRSSRTPRATSERQPPQDDPSSTPGWVAEFVEIDAADGPLRSNRDPAFPSWTLSPRHLRVLSEIIRDNGLDEAVSAGDYDDGDGVFEPWELGFQIWQNGKLVVLALGPDPYWSFDYDIDRLPDSIADLDTLQLLDVHGNALASLPAALGELLALRDLRLQGNRLSDLPPELGTLYRLRQLALGSNDLWTLPESIGDLNALERLHLDDNPLEALPESIGDLTDLQELAVAQRGGDTQGLVWLPDGIAQLPALEKLYLAGNRLGCGGGGGVLRLEGGVLVFGAAAQACP